MSVFSKGIKKIDEFSREDNVIYPEELIGKKCGECVRCQKRDRAEGYHCTMQKYGNDITPDDKACVYWWDKARHEEVERLNKEAEENRRKELWAIYAEKEPVKLPILFDGFGNVPQCPVCGEMPYSTEQCYWCGQRFIQDAEVEEYNKPDIGTMDCFQCGGKGTVEFIRSKYNGHKHGECKKCGMRFME